jgi:3-phenylpropionate/trans-cinnamate dioxygenase ferredoxin subunit
MPDFITIGTVDELNPGGEPIVVEINNRWIAVFNVGGEIYAIEDICTHDGGPLAEGKLEGWVVECPRHGATFDVRTGEALSAPAFEDVSAYETKVVDNEIRIGPSKN